MSTRKALVSIILGVILKLFMLAILKIVLDSMFPEEARTVVPPKEPTPS